MKKLMGDNIEIDIADILSSKKSDDSLAFTSKNRGRVLDYYISGEIESSDRYAEWFDAIRNCNSNDVVRFHINSQGGELFTAIQFMRVIAECPACTVASVEGACFSAATLIFLACDTFEVSPHSSFMVHNYSGGACGKGGEMMDQLTFESKWAETLFNEAYTDFLSPAEILSVLKGQDVWMSADQVVARLNARTELREAVEKAPSASSGQSIPA